MSSSSLAILLLAAAALHAQDPEAGIGKPSPTERLFSIDTNSPMNVAAEYFAGAYHMHVNAEDPVFACPDDLTNTGPKGAAFELRYRVDRNRMPVDRLALLQQTVTANNQHSHFRYRLQINGDVYTFVPIEGRDKNCRMAPMTAILDRKISIPKGNRPLWAQFREFDKALNAVTGQKSFLNYQAFLNFSQHYIPFEAHDEPARDVLIRLLRATHYRIYYLARGGGGSAGYIINLVPLTIVHVHNGLHVKSLLWPGQHPLPPLPNV